MMVSVLPIIITFVGVHKNNGMKNIVRKLLMVLWALMAVQSASAGKPIREWWVAMPDSLLPLLSKNNRLDFVDFIDSRMEAVVTNRLDGKSQMKTLTENYLQMSYTATCDVSMKLLPLTDSTEVLCLVTTMHGKVPDSRVAFYDKAWEELPTENFFTEPVMTDFRNTVENDSAAVEWKKMDVFFKTYTLSPENLTLSCRLTTMDYLNEQDRKSISPYLQGDTIIYSWSEGRFVR